ncbi:MAG TPA: hypothetical protein VLA72_10470, partial [Anaerolineales bacterium]|nr:hypothetical protein [Anaerolineales bacterium]
LFSTDRPFMGVIYSLVYRLLGESYVNWHWYALIWRFIGGLAFFWILRLIWPKEKYITTLMTVLFIVYPGFLSQPNANTKQNHLYGFGTALLSIAFMIQAMKTNIRVWKIIYSVLSIILTINYLFIYEYMIGFEGTRLLLLGFILYQEGFNNFRSFAKEIFKKFWLYLMAIAGFVYWRIFIFESTRNATDTSRLFEDYLGDLRYMSIRLILETAKDFLDVTIFAWFVQPYQLFSSSRYSDLANALLITVIVIAFVLLYTFLFKKRWGVDVNEPETPHLIKEFLLLGIFTTVFAIVPVILFGRQVDLNDAYKSYGLHPIGGVVMFIVGLVLMFQYQFRRLILIALIGISVSAQALNADYWAQLWDYQRETWWQLTWRAPDIKDDTMVIAYLPEGFRIQQDYEVWGPVNLIYRPGMAETPAIQSEVLTIETTYDVLRGNVRSNRIRDIKMNRDFNNLLLISLPSSSSCMQVIDGTLPVYSADEAFPVQQIGGYSHVDRIIPIGEPPVPSSSIFGSEPEHDWCYYYQKASLARQTGDWKEVGRLYDKTISLGLDTDDKAEMIPFFEALVNLGRFEEAENLYREQIRGQARVRFPLCTLLEEDPGYPPEFGYNYEMINLILCKS